MRAEQLHSSYTVVVDVEDVRAFAASWPCSGLDTDASYGFTFSSGNGDLVDTEMTVDGRTTDTSGSDGPALAALSEDAGLFGARELGLEDVLAIRYPDVASAPAP